MRLVPMNTLLILCMIPILHACNQPQKDNPEKAITTEPAKTVPELVLNSQQNDFYKTLAGMGAQKKISDSQSYIAYNTQWSDMNKKLLEPIGNWKKGILPADCQQTKTLFYPFSGPDFIIPNTLFPDMEKITMFGLEIPGQDISTAGLDYAAALIPKMRNSLRDYFGKSYFITKNMIDDLRQDTLRGVTPFIASFIVRSGYNLVSLRNFLIDSTGNKVYLENQELALAKTSSTKGIEIIYTADQKNKRTIDYLSFNAEDANLNSNPGILAFFEKNIAEQTTTYLKSASYLLHYASFSKIRDLSLRKSKYLLQDDTGIPYKYLSKNWTCQIFGEYVKPIADFSGVYQKDLDSVYRSNKVTNQLPFSMGYHYHTGKQNLLFATKK